MSRLTIGWDIDDTLVTPSVASGVGTINIKVKRIKNSISRTDWNKNKKI